MASIRRLKKDVDYLTFAVIADCMNYNSSVGKSEPEVVNIVKKMVDIEMKREVKFLLVNHLTIRKKLDLIIKEYLSIY